MIAITVPCNQRSPGNRSRLPAVADPYNHDARFARSGGVAAGCPHGIAGAHPRGCRRRWDGSRYMVEAVVRALVAKTGYRAPATGGVRASVDGCLRVYARGRCEPAPAGGVEQCNPSCEWTSSVILRHCFREAERVACTKMDGQRRRLGSRSAPAWVWSEPRKGGRSCPLSSPGLSPGEAR